MITKRNRRQWPALALLIILGAAACGSPGTGEGGMTDSAPDRNSASESQSNGEAAPDDGAESEGNADSGRDAGESDSDASNRSRPPLEQRSIIRTGSISVRTEEPNRAADRAEKLVDDGAGFVGERAQEQYPGSERLQVEVTLRVPVKEFDSVRGSIAELGEVTQDKHEATDVTDEVVDVASRIENQERSIERLRSLMSEADDVGEVVEVESELQTRESDLESLQARQQSLSEQASLSTLTATFTEPSPEPDEEDEAQLGFLTGLRGGWEALLSTGTVLLTVAGAVAPFLPLVLLIALPLGWQVRRWLRQRATRQPAPEPRPET